MQETQVQSPGQEDPLEKEMATHSNTLPWKIPWTEEPGRLQFMGSQRVRHDWTISLSLSFTFLVKGHLGLCWNILFHCLCLYFSFPTRPSASVAKTHLRTPLRWGAMLNPSSQRMRGRASKPKPGPDWNIQVSWGIEGWEHTPPVGSLRGFRGPAWGMFCFLHWHKGKWQLLASLCGHSKYAKITCLFFICCHARMTSSSTVPKSSCFQRAPEMPQAIPRPPALCLETSLRSQAVEPAKGKEVHALLFLV